MAKLAQDLSDLLSDRPDQSALTGAMEGDRAQAQEFYRQLALLQQHYNEQRLQQAGTARQLDAQIRGTAPSVANTQLMRGVSQIGDAARATTAGASGNNAALGNYGAIQAMGQAQAKANADAAVLRANEINQATMAKANVLGQQQQATGQQTAAATAGGTALSGQQTSAAGKVADLNAGETAAQRNLLGNVVQGGGSLLAAMSDETKKTDIQPVAGNEMDDFLNHIAGFTFKFKPDAVGPTAPAGERVGPMAQDVHSGGPIGEKVSDGKQIDMRNAIGALLAAVSHVNRKVEARG